MVGNESPIRLRFFVIKLYVECILCFAEILLTAPNMSEKSMLEIVFASDLNFLPLQHELKDELSQEVL